LGATQSVKRRRSRPVVALGPIILAALLLALLVGPTALAQTVRAGNLVVTVEGGFTPHRLPRKKRGAITLSARSTIATADGSHLPALEELNLEFDKHTGVNTEGLATCTVGELENTTTKTAKRICASALIGTGQAGAEIEFPEQPPFFAKAPMLIFNGPTHDGHPVFVFQVYAFVPAPTTFVTTAQIEKASGLYGTKVRIKVPSIVAGQGSLSLAELSIHKTWSEKGKKETLLYGSCPTGHFFVRGNLLFNDGFRMNGKVVRSCTPAG
jgi:hypothetical protein